MCHLCCNTLSKELNLLNKKNHRSLMAKNPKLKGVWEKISTLQAVSERRFRKFHFPPFSILRLPQDVKVQGFNYRSLSPPDILVASKEC